MVGGWPVKGRLKYLGSSLLNFRSNSKLHSPSWNSRISSCAPFCWVTFGLCRGYRGNNSWGVLLFLRRHYLILAHVFMSQAVMTEHVFLNCLWEDTSWDIIQYMTVLLALPVTGLKNFLTVLKIIQMLNMFDVNLLLVEKWCIRGENAVLKRHVEILWAQMNSCWHLCRFHVWYHSFLSLVWNFSECNKKSRL